MSAVSDAVDCPAVWIKQSSVALYMQMIVQTDRIYKQQIKWSLVSL